MFWVPTSMLCSTTYHVQGAHTLPGAGARPTACPAWARSGPCNIELLVSGQDVLTRSSVEAYLHPWGIYCVWSAQENDQRRTYRAGQQGTAQGTAQGTTRAPSLRLVQDQVQVKCGGTVGAKSDEGTTPEVPVFLLVMKQWVSIVLGPHPCSRNRKEMEKRSTCQPAQTENRSQLPQPKRSGTRRHSMGLQQRGSGRCPRQGESPGPHLSTGLPQDGDHLDGGKDGEDELAAARD